MGCGLAIAVRDGCPGSQALLFHADIRVRTRNLVYGLLYKRARVRVPNSVRLICGYLFRSLLPFLTCIYDTLLDLEIIKMRVSSGIVFLKTVYQAMPSISVLGCP